MLTLTKATDDHVDYMAPRLRKADMEEIDAYSGLTPLEGLAQSKASSPLCNVLINDGVPVAIYGGIPQGNGTANVWMLATDGITTSAKQFLRHSRDHMDTIHNELNSSLLYAFSDPRNTLHQMWLVYAGFALGTLITVRNHNFITVTRLKCV